MSSWGWGLGLRGLKLLQQLQLVVVELLMEVRQAVLKNSLHLQALRVHASQNVQLALVQRASVEVHLWKGHVHDGDDWK